MFPILGIRDLKIRLQRRQRERHKTNMSNPQNNNSARALRFFVHFLLPSLLAYYVKLPRFTFHGGRKLKATIFVFFFWPQIQSFRIYSWKISQHLTNWMKWNKEVWNSAIQVSFSLPLRKTKRSCLYQHLYLQGISCTYRRKWSEALMPAIKNTHAGLSLRTGGCGFLLATFTENRREKKPPKNL